MSFFLIGIKIYLGKKEVIFIMETLGNDTITPLEWLKTEADATGSTKRTTLNSDNDGPSTTWTSEQPNDNDD